MESDERRVEDTTALIPAAAEGSENSVVSKLRTVEQFLLINKQASKFVCGLVSQAILESISQFGLERVDDRSRYPNVFVADVCYLDRSPSFDE